MIVVFRLRMSDWKKACVVAWVAMLAGGCSPYRLQGVVIEGPEPGIEVVGKDDPRLEAVGLASAELTVRLDPKRLSPQTIGRATSDSEGGFSIPINEPGAGVLILDVDLFVTRPDYQGVRQRFDLPGSGRRVVVTLKRGKGGDRDEGNVLEQTLRDAEPFLRD